jgi:hypothetical protein
MFFPAADTIAFTEGGTESMRIDSSGNVGIGTTSPAKRLAVQNATDSTTVGTNAVMMVQAGTSVNSVAEIGFGFNGFTSTNPLCTVGYQITSNAGLGLGALTFSTRNVTTDTAPTERMRITSGGAVCIGRTTEIFSGNGLCVQTSSNSVNAVVTSSSQSALSAVNTAVNTGTSCSLMSFNVGISGGGSQVGTITYNGTLVQYNTTSDQRLKKNIVDAGSGLAKLANVKIRAFDWVEHNSHTDFGVVAQELNEVAPEAVSVGDTGETIKRIWGVDTSTLVPAIIKAIQEQQQIINDLKARIETLENA